MVVGCGMWVMTQCVQPGKVSNGYSEDCLFMNIYAPLASLGDQNKRLPVMLWIHGGAYVTGGSNYFFGDYIVSAALDSVVVVTINYRLNIFGFLGSKEIQATVRCSLVASIACVHTTAGLTDKMTA
jgi:carboxylesterase type B